jgi:2-iminobutanoate/2-iminopropanoate deaminase
LILERFKTLFYFSQAVSVGKTLYISGQLGMDCKTGAIVEGGIKNETEQSLKNMGEILKSIGATYNNGILFFLIIHR